MANNYILIDGSYFIFYRYYALNVWWNLAKPDEEKPPVECPEFVEKFKSTFVSKIHDIDKNLKLKNTIKYVGKDCRRSEIWRTALYPAYKATRGLNNDFLGAPLFDIAYGGGAAPVCADNAPVCGGAVPVGVNTTNILYGDKVTIPPTASGIALFEKANVKQILSYPSLEADDCIALMAKHLYTTEPDAHIWIIASDMDYLQITNDRIHLYDLKFKNICEKSSGDPLQDLFCKIVAGDKSDNIPPIFKKCGIKTAQKYFKDRDLFLKKLAQDKEAQAIYKLNTTLVDFNSIPIELVDGFMTTHF